MQSGRVRAMDFYMDDISLRRFYRLVAFFCCGRTWAPSGTSDWCFLELAEDLKGGGAAKGRLDVRLSYGGVLRLWVLPDTTGCARVRNVLCGRRGGVVDPYSLET